MNWLDRIIVAVAKFFSRIITMFRLGAGATWPGEIALRLSPSILKSLAQSVGKGIILVVGTNGKTTTSLMIVKILEHQGLSVVHNASGANLVNGIVSALILKSQADWGIFEVDENSLPVVLSQCHSGLRAGIHENENGSRVKPGMTKKLVVVMLNLFRDQLDRYGEVDVIVEKWQKSLSSLDSRNQLQLVVNADDPGVAFLGKSHKNVIYFGVNDATKYAKTAEHATDSTFCPKCGNRLTYDGVYYSHIGIWHCTKCGAKRPKPAVFSFPSALPGLYNQYNTLAAVATAKALGFGGKKTLEASLRSFAPAFGRQEEIVVGGKRIKLFLSKNPAGFNASLRTVLEMGAKDMLFVLNDRIPDGRDMSWIWDVDFEMLPSDITPVVSGDRAWDMTLRLKYALEKPPTTYEHLETALKFFTESSDITRPLYVLATYSAMLEVRKILTGRKIL